MTLKCKYTILILKNNIIYILLYLYLYLIGVRKQD